jgi:hypothetical protein
MPPVFIRFPTRMKKGIARRVNPVVLEYILAGTIKRTSTSPSTTKKMTEVKAIQTEMGNPTMIKKTRTAKIAAVIMARLSPNAIADRCAKGAA